MATVNFDPPHGGRSDAKAFGGQLYLVTGRVTFSSSYTTGGETVDLSNWLKDVKGFIASPIRGYTFEYDYTNKKLKAFSAANTEVTSSTNLSSVTTRFIAWGYQ